MEAVKRLLAVASLMVFSLSAFAADDANNRSISVAGEAEIKVTPDEVILVLGVETDDMDMDAAKTENDRRVEEILKIARQEGITEKYLQTDRIKADPRYSYYHDKRTFLGYRVHKRITVTLTDTTISLFDRLLTDLLSAGATHVHDVQLKSTELRKYRDEARSMAIRAAREKATALAGELGMQLGKASSIVEGGEGSPAWYGRYWRSPAPTFNAVSVAGDPAEVEGSIALGQISVTASVSVVFDME